MTSTATTRSTPWKKIVATGAIVVGAGAIITGGAFAVFTDSDSTTAAVDAGQLDIVASGNVTVTDIAPGDTVQRPVTFTLPNATNDGDLVSAVRFYFDVTADTIGTNDPALTGPGESLVTGADGLVYTLSTCVGGTWTAPTTAPAGPYTCGGTTTVTTGTAKLSTINGVANAVDFTPANFGLTPTATGTFPSDAGDVALNSLIQFVLPTAADNDYENASTALTFTAAAIQRGGIQK